MRARANTVVTGAPAGPNPWAPTMIANVRQHARPMRGARTNANGGATVMLARMDDEGADEDGLPPAPACPECGTTMEPETFTGSDRIHIAYLCPRHGIGWTLDPFSDEK